MEKYHYSLGMSLYSMTDENLVGDIVYSIADQIKHGIVNLDDENPILRVEFAKLNDLAGMQAAANADHAASRSYFTYALAFLPTAHWKSHHDLSLRFSFRLAKSCYSCGDSEKAHCILGETMAKCHSFQDKLPGYALLARSESHHASSTFMRETFVIFYVAINSCVLSQFIWIVKISWTRTYFAKRP
jgi:histidine kinase